MVEMQAERQHVFTFAFVVACTKCYQAVCYELMHYQVRLHWNRPPKVVLPRDATQSAVRIAN